MGRAAASHDLDRAIVLERGLTVTGRVVDAAGRPIRGAEVVMGHDRWGTNPPSGWTDERGQFILENCDAGPTMVTVQARGFAPWIHEVRVVERTPPMEVTLTEPGAIIRGKVVDVQGRPVAGAFFTADTWRGFRSLRFHVDTDKDGRFERRDAPKDVVLFDIGKEGYMAARHVPLTASDREQSVILYSELVIEGRVTDAVTGRPVEKVRVVQGRRFQGQARIDWSENEGADASDGRFISRFDEPAEALFVRVEAEGYKTSDSRAFRTAEGRQTVDFTLEAPGCSRGSCSCRMAARPRG